MALSKSVFNPAKAIHSKVVIFSLLLAAFLVLLFFISTLVMDDDNDFFDKKKHNKAHVDITQEVKELLEDAKLQEQTGEHKTIEVKINEDLIPFGVSKFLTLRYGEISGLCFHFTREAED